MIQQNPTEFCGHRVNSMEKLSERIETDAQSVACINWRVFILLSLISLVCYSNTFNASFHFDDFHNITQNTNLHIENLYPGTIYDALSGDSGRIFYRPTSNLSIALNWYFGKEDVAGYHVVNLGIHILTGFFLFLSVLMMFKTPNITGRYRGDEYFIAVLAATLWVINPIQTQAVTYIVQRMAAMATMFYIMGIFFFITARISDSWKKKSFLFLGVSCCFLLAIGSKENAIMLPVSLLLLEVVLFRDMSDKNTRKRVVLWASGLIFFVFVCGVFFFLNGSFFESIIGGYKSRTFSLFERLLTEARIVLFYLTQIFYPIADRLSLDHDIVVSTGFFSPWTTFPAIFLIIILLGIAVWQINKSPFFSLAVLFFFLNHIIESSFVALELIFEHRNYLPSLFLFLPVAAGLKTLINHYQKNKKQKTMAGVLICFIVIFIIMLGMGTYIRNMAWADEKTLWEDVIQKAPGRARAYQNLATSYYAMIGHPDMVMKLSEKAMYLEDNTRHKAEIVSLSNMAEVYAKEKRNYDKAIEMYNRILSIQPDRMSTIHSLVLILIETGQISMALEHINQALSKKNDSKEFLNLKAFLLLKQNDPDIAMSYLKKVIMISPDDEHTLLNTGMAKMMTGKYDSAEHYLNRLQQRVKNNITLLFLLIENSMRANDIQKAEKYVDALVSGFTSTYILKSLNQISEEELQWPVSTKLISPVIVKKMKEQSNALREYGKTNDR